MPKKAHGKAIYWPQAYVQRAVDAMRQSRSSDPHTLARLALQVAIRSRDDIDELLEPAPRGRRLAGGTRPRRERYQSLSSRIKSAWGPCSGSLALSVFS
jgi:hypothetical protein